MQASATADGVHTSGVDGPTAATVDVAVAVAVAVVVVFVGVVVAVVAPSIFSGPEGLVTYKNTNTIYNMFYIQTDAQTPIFPSFYPPKLSVCVYSIQDYFRI